MRIIEPRIEVEKYDGIKIMKNIEKACRTCYRSEGNITEDSYKNLLKNCINKGHESVLEHEKITVRMVCDIGVYKDLTRHRFGSFSIESTRYCAYDKDRFGGELVFIQPIFFSPLPNDPEDQNLPETREQMITIDWFEAMYAVENSYLGMRSAGATPDECRMIVPHSTAAEVVMTANIREWKHILELRANNHAHPSVQQLMIPLLLNFKENMPEIFGEIKYNEQFSPSLYAKLTIMDE